MTAPRSDFVQMGLAITAAALSARQGPLGLRAQLTLARAALKTPDADLRAAVSRFLDAHDRNPAEAGETLLAVIQWRCAAAPVRHAWQERADLDG
ncbi:hypothetical protein BYZ73_21705 [Rhodovulum viride]|uniref:Uncharacterized protein n=1 Tax=Rhodovulum viride TaxID=1231134 RepID=A0ABX9DBY8_9RHOB|nr:hypothetical protein [Rhodovulum viride]RAP38782.1 hypothetical protein BYZ73_21705 [Rhodovulum viride]